MAKVIAKQKQEVLKTPQEFIHVSHTINLRQYKYWLLILKVYKAGVDNNVETNTMKISLLEEWLGYSISRAELETDLKALRSETITMNKLSKDGKPVFRVDGFINSAEIIGDEITFEVGNWIRDAYHNIEDYGSIFNLLNWSIFNHFTGKYEAILYKLCSDYSGVGSTKKLTVEEYRDYMGLKSTEYPEFKDLNKYLISSPVNKINTSELSDITIEPVFSRKGRKVDSVQFKVAKRKTSAAAINNKAFLKVLVPITVQKQETYLKDFTEEEIAASIDRANAYILEQEKNGQPVKNMASVYNRAITDNWGSELIATREKTEEISQERKEKKQAAKKSAFNEVVKNETYLELDAKSNAKRDEALWDYFEKLTQDKKDEIVKEPLSANSIVFKEYAAGNFTKPIVKFAILSHLRKVL